MTIDEIKQAWKQSATHPVDASGKIKAGSTHDKFTAEMCKKTVINRACKPIINSSDDSNLVVRMAKETDAEFAEAEVAQEIEENANTETIDIEASVIEDEQPEEEKQIEPESSKPAKDGAPF